jgi:hypothetical protein
MCEGAGGESGVCVPVCQDSGRVQDNQMFPSTTWRQFDTCARNGGKGCRCFLCRHPCALLTYLPHVYVVPPDRLWVFYAVLCRDCSPPSASGPPNWSTSLVARSSWDTTSMPTAPMMPSLLQYQCSGAT